MINRFEQDGATEKSLRSAVRRAQLREVMIHLRSASMAGPFTAIVLVFALSTTIPQKTLLATWLAVTVFIYVLRHVYVVWLKHLPTSRIRTQRSLNLFVLFNIVTASCWGLLSGLYDPSWPPNAQIMLWLVLAGVASSSVSSYAMYFPALVAFVASLWVPVTVFLVIDTNRSPMESVMVVFVLMFYGGVVLDSGWRFSRTLKDNLRTRIELERANQQLQKQADHDPLTQLLNRRGFDRRLKTEWARHAREKLAISALMIDIDYFKRYNDHYGHDRGDRCIQAVAEAIGASAERPGDLVARYGGEEFIVLLANTQEAQALTVAERIMAKVNELAIPHAGNPDGKQVTVSIGAATALPTPGEDEALLYLSADEKLYVAKSAGRNRIES